MNFKKLLSLIGMLTVVVPTSLTVIACNSQTNNDIINENKVQKLLEKGIDGSKLGVTNTQADALKLIQNSQGVKGIATLAFVNDKDSTKLLNLGNNILNIKITVGNKTVNTDKALITNISATTQERLKALKQELENGIDGSSLSIVNVQQDALNLIISQVINIDPTINFVFVNQNDKDNHLTGGNNNLNIKVSIEKDIINANALITNVNPVNPDDQTKVDAIKKSLESGIDGSSLSIVNIQKDALKLMQESPIVKDNKGTLLFVNDADKDQNLTGGDSMLNIKITVNTASTTTNKALITNVNPISPIDKEVTDNINKTSYKLSDITDSTKVADVKARISADFIKQSLNSKIQQKFDNQKYHFQDILFNNHSLNDEDLLSPQTIETQIFYSYGSVKDNETNLTITISKTYSFSDIEKDLINNLKASPISLTIDSFDKREDGEKAVQQLLANNKEKYFKNALDNKYRHDFEDKYLGLFNHVYMEPHFQSYVPEDFFTIFQTTTVYFYIAYNKDTNINNSGDYIPINLTINMNEDDIKVTKAIHNTTFNLSNIVEDTTVKNLYDQITTEFIKQSLPNDIQNLFDSEKFKFDSIQIKDSKTGWYREITDQDLSYPGSLENCLFSYFYGKVENPGGPTQINITINKRYSYADIQNELIKNINNNPLNITVNKTTNRVNGELEVQKLLENNKDLYFKNILDSSYQKDFDGKYLGIYNHVYKEPHNEGYVDDDFFQTEKNVIVYVYIGYNETAQTDNNGDYIMIQLTVK